MGQNGPRLNLVFIGNNMAYLGPRLQNIDSACQIRWSMNETVGPWVNTGNGAAASLSVQSGIAGHSKSRQALLGLGIDNASLDNIYATGTGSSTCTVGESNSITISFAINFRTFTNQQLMLSKLYYNTNSWSSPFNTIGVFLNGTAGAWDFFVVTGGTLKTCNMRASLVLNAWNLITCTYDASTGIQTGYVNGSAVGTFTNAATNLDWGTHGAWQIGGVLPNANQNSDATFNEIRVDNVVRSAAYIDAYSRAAFKLI